ncbi:hypothetical protein ACJEEW_12730 [Bacteroides cellulosilyticus]
MQTLDFGENYFAIQLVKMLKILLPIHQRTNIFSTFAEENKVAWESR